MAIDPNTTRRALTTHELAARQCVLAERQRASVGVTLTTRSQVVVSIVRRPKPPSAGSCPVTNTPKPKPLPPAMETLDAE